MVISRLLRGFEIKIGLCQLQNGTNTVTKRQKRQYNMLCYCKARLRAFGHQSALRLPIMRVGTQKWGSISYIMPNIFHQYMILSLEILLFYLVLITISIVYQLVKVDTTQLIHMPCLYIPKAFDWLVSRVFIWRNFISKFLEQLKALDLKKSEIILCLINQPFRKGRYASLIIAFNLHHLQNIFLNF